VSPDPIRIRPARIGDAAALASLMERTFSDAFGPANRPEDLAAHIARSYSPEIQARELADPDCAILLADAGGTLAGYAQLRTGEAPAAVTGPAPRQLWRFYVDRAWHGKGLAQRLMQAAREEARARGARTLWLGVWEENPRGIAFYSKEGFEAVGHFLFHVGDDPQRDLIMAHSLD
jgi:GNAT superfamily N-acetyltransferase